MYERTVNRLSDFQIAHIEQQRRQLKIVDVPVTLYINMAREDFPDVTARIEVTYIPSASSQAWAKLLKDACKLLKIDFIHSILDRADKSPVHRVLRLRPEGDYLARQRETSAILEVINTGRTPVEVSWDITMDINDVKQALALDQRNMPIIDRRVAALVSKPATRETQREITTLILNAVSPKAAVGIIEQFHRQYQQIQTAATETAAAEGVASEPMTSTAAAADPQLGDIAKYGDAIDIISLHRLCLETLGRWATKGKAKQIAGTGPCFEYIRRVVSQLRQEVDVACAGLKLLSDVMKYLVEQREQVFHLVLDCVQAYAPPASQHRPRQPKRLIPVEDAWEEGEGGGEGEGAGAQGTGTDKAGSGTVTAGGPVSVSIKGGGAGGIRVGGSVGKSSSAKTSTPAPGGQQQQQQSALSFVKEAVMAPTSNFNTKNNHNSGGGRAGGPSSGIVGGAFDGSSGAAAAGGMHPSLARYGDFYGHSSAGPPGAVQEMSELIRLTAGNKNTDVLNRFLHPEVPAAVVLAPASDGAPSPALVAAPAAPSSVDVKALVRGRVRVDHGAASSAIQTAFQQPTAATVKQQQLLRGEKTDAADDEEFLRQQQEFREQRKLNETAKFKFKIKSRSGTATQNTGESGEEELEVKKEWKGTIGVIGR